MYFMERRRDLCGAMERQIKERYEVIQIRYCSVYVSDRPCFWIQNLDLTKGKMVHEGPLSWKVNKDKSIGQSRPRNPTPNL